MNMRRIEYSLIEFESRRNLAVEFLFEGKLIIVEINFEKIGNDIIMNEL